MSKKYELNSKYRVLLTELLPYELPLVFDNYAFFQICYDENKRLFYEGLVNIGNSDWTIPFDYDIYQKSGTKKRRLSVIHPAIQLGWVDLYEEYADYLLYLCAKSPYSIRYIYKTANCLFNDEELKDEVEEEDGEMTDEPAQETEASSPQKVYRSYFQYRKFDFIFKYYESFDILRLEQKYPYLLTTDISHCFYHIYTHSVAWAIRGKDVAKNQIGGKYQDLLENQLDTLMQHSNYNETNGIVVGPEVSRIFAEIILQRVDVDVMQALKEKGLNMGVDYEIRRYVDDYFIYAYRREDLDAIKKEIERCLSVYKLNLNVAKTNYYERPFASNITDFKREVLSLINWLREEIKDAKPIADGALYRNFIHKFKSLVHHCDVKYVEIGSYVMSKLLRLIKQAAKKNEDDPIPLFKENVMTNLIEIVFYIYSLDMNSASSFKLCRIIYFLAQQAKKQGTETFSMEIKARIEREIKRCFDYQVGVIEGGEMNLESLNLLITWHRVYPNSIIDKNRLAVLFGRTISCNIEEGDWGRLNYFQIATMLYIIEDNPDYSDWKLKAIDQVSRKLNAHDWRKHADNVFMLLDMLTCPYLTKDVKADLMVNAGVCSAKERAKRKLSEMSSAGIKRWFWDWDKNRDFGQVLMKKAYRPAY